MLKDYIENRIFNVFKEIVEGGKKSQTHNQTKIPPCTKQTQQLYAICSGWFKSVLNKGRTQSNSAWSTFYPYFICLILQLHPSRWHLQFHTSLIFGPWLKLIYCLCYMVQIKKTKRTTCFSEKKHANYNMKTHTDLWT